VLIAIDFDETLTADPSLWAAFIDLARGQGHIVCCVTARRDTDENREDIEDWMQEHRIDLRTHYTSLASKVDFMKRRGFAVDIWIDDDPRKCALGH
jgi:hypothetical protein